MKYKSIILSSGHGKHVSGASGILNEVEQARHVVDTVGLMLRAHGVKVRVFNDDTSKTQNENLNTIVSFHNAHARDLDVSVHFNAHQKTDKPMGTECLYVSQSTLATAVAKSISSVGLINRGAKYRSDLFFLNHTEKPAILIEVCFVDSTADCATYDEHFDLICQRITEALVGVKAGLYLEGKVSWFGGPDDKGVAADEPLAFIHKIEDAPHLFLKQQPPGTTGLARRLNPDIFYVACRWDYDDTPHAVLLSKVALVKAVKTGITRTAFPADWGPHQDTGRVADISPGLMSALGISTDDEVTVLFPAQ